MEEPADLGRRGQLLTAIRNDTRDPFCRQFALGWVLAELSIDKLESLVDALGTVQDRLEEGRLVDAPPEAFDSP